MQTCLRMLLHRLYDYNIRLSFCEEITQFQQMLELNDFN